MSPKRSTSPGFLPIALIGVGFLLIVAVVIWQLNAHSIPTTEAEIQRVTLVQAKTAFDQSSAVFLDVRDASSYANAHIPGAVNIPLAQMQSRLQELPKDRWIIPYCT